MCNSSACSELGTADTTVEGYCRLHLVVLVTHRQPKPLAEFENGNDGRDATAPRKDCVPFSMRLFPL